MVCNLQIRSMYFPSWQQKFNDNEKNSAPYSPQPTRTPLTGSCHLAESIDISLHCLCFFMMYAAMFEDSWKALTNFLTNSPTAILNEAWLTFYVIVPVNTLVFDATLSFDTTKNGISKLKMTQFLTNRFLLEYMNTITKQAKFATRETIDKYSVPKNEDIRAMMETPIRTSKSNTKFQERNVDTVMKAICLLYPYHVAECKYFWDMESFLK